MKNYLITCLTISLLICFTNDVLAQKKSYGKSRSGEKLSKLKKNKSHKRQSSKTIYRKTKKSNRVDAPNYASNAIIKEAYKYLGLRYRYGGESPRSGFDCSGLVQYVFRKNGINLPRTSREQARIGNKISINKVKPGDLVFFAKNGSRISHVGIVSSQPGKPLTMIHAASGGVTTTNIKNSNYWNKRMKFARRI